VTDLSGFDVAARSHPLVTCGAIWLLLIAIAGGRPVHRALGSRSRMPLLVLSLAILVACLTIAFWYGFQLTYYDRAEPTITAVSSVFSAGRPLYPSLDAAERYAHIYGPALFMVQSAAMGLFGESIRVSKLVGAIALVWTLLLGLRVFAIRAGLFTAIALSGACALLFLDFSNAAFWTRPDPLLLLCVALGLYSTTLRSSVAAVSLLGLVVGLSVNLKVSGPLYLLPACVLLQARTGRRSWVAIGAIASVIALAPFAFPAVSLSNYLSYLRLSAANGIAPAALRQNLEWALFLLAPILGLIHVERGSLAPRAPRNWFVMTVGASVVVVSVIAAKPGGGAYHLLPFVPVIAYAAALAPQSAWMQPRMQAWALAFCLTTIVVAVPRQTTFVRTVSARDLGPIVSELRDFYRAHSGHTIEVGYSGTSYVSDARPEMVFHTRSYLLDAPAVQEYRRAGLDMPQATIQAIRDCVVEYWLIPAGAAPFDVPSAYWPAGPPDVFSKTFQDTFQLSYRQTGTTRNFSVWECRQPRAQ
jgi:hypothetical protein